MENRGEGMSEEKQAIVLTGGQIPIARLMTLRAGLKLEASGIRMSRGPSALSILKKEFKWKGNREKILKNLNAVIEEMKNDLKSEGK
jgi:hypothetical protein